MNFRKRRANAWAGLYVGLVGTDENSANGRPSDDRAEGNRSADSD